MKKIRTFALIVGILLAVGCATDDAGDFTTLNLHQPSILSLEKGKPINTKDGVYTPQKDEVWHSDKRYRDIERKLLLQ